MYLAVTTSRVTAPAATNAIDGTLQHASSLSRESVSKGVTVFFGTPSLLPRRVATADPGVALAHVVGRAILLEVPQSPRRVLKQHRRTTRQKTTKGIKHILQDKQSQLSKARLFPIVVLFKGMLLLREVLVQQEE